MTKQIEVLFGRLGQDPELKYTPKGTAVCEFSITLSTTKDESPTWKKIVAWGKLAEVCKVQLKKGNQIFVRGQNEQRNFTTKEGQQKTFSEIKAFEISGLILAESV